MINSIFLDIILGLSFIYLLYSFLCLVITEILTRLNGKRVGLFINVIKKGFENTELCHLVPVNKKQLEDFTGEFKVKKTIKNIKPEQLADIIKNKIKSDTITTHRVQKYNTPIANYIDNLTGFLGEIELMDENPSKMKEIDQKTLIEQLESKLVKKAESILDSVAELYKKHAQKLGLLIAFLVVFFNNVDTIQFANRIANDPVYRGILVSSSTNLPDEPFIIEEDTNEVAKPGAQEVEKTDTQKAEKESTQEAEKEEPKNVINPKVANYLKTVSDNEYLNLGVTSWCKEPLFNKKAKAYLDYKWVVQKILGLLITVLLVSLGAPFWLEAIKKCVSLKKKA